VNQTVTVKALSRAVMRGGAMAQEWNASMTCSLFSRTLRVWALSFALPETLEGRLEPQTHCQRPGTRRRLAAQFHSE
jgi:hypothetical protein